MKKRLPAIAASSALLFANLPFTASAEEAATAPVGMVQFNLLRNSDTYVCTPLEKNQAFIGEVSSLSGFTVSVSPSPSFGSFTTVPHYVQAVDGAQAGIIFDVASNTADSITVVDNGLSPTGFTVGTKFKVVEYWTLGSLFPLSAQNVSFTPSASTLGVARRTQVLFPNVVGSGINRSASSTYFFVTGTYWRSTTASTVNADNTPIPPDSYIIIRNPSTTADGLTLTVVGNVNIDPTAVQLDRLATGANDNYVGFSRPVATTLNDLGLIASGAFMPSAGTLGVARRDVLIVLDNSTIGFNKAAAATYFYLDNGTVQSWRNTASSGADAGATLIPPGSAISIRKYNASPATTQFWTHDLNIGE